MERRAPQRLCPRCRGLLDLGRKRAKEFAELEASGEKVRVAIGTRFHYGTDAFLSFLVIKDTDVLQALVQLGGLERTYGGSYAEARRVHFKCRRPGYYDRNPAQYVWGTPGQADDIELVLDYIQMVIEKAYSDGQVNGRSLIRRLAVAGTKELNEIVTGKHYVERETVSKDLE